MFARVFTSPSLHASARSAPRVQRILISRRTMSSQPHSGNDVRRGFDEIVPFLKRIPVDVYPLVGFVSFVCVLGVIFSTKNLLTDKTLRLKPTGAN